MLHALSNTALTNLDGLANVTSVGGVLVIRDNVDLINCQGLATVLGWPNGPPDDAVDSGIYIRNNGAGCNSIDEIFAALHAVTPFAGANGDIDPSSVQAVVSGASVSFTLIPDDGYEIAGVGGTCGGVLSGSTYTTTSVTADCTVEAQFQIEAPPSEPQAPTITRTDVGDGEISIWAAVTNDGGRPVISYVVTCTDGTNTFSAYTGTSATSPITVDGLTNGVAYTCTVTATNSVGTSQSSARTEPITPEELPTGLPIWLLYEASK